MIRMLKFGPLQKANVARQQLTGRFYISLKDFVVDDDVGEVALSSKLSENFPLSKKINGRFVSPWTKETEKKPFQVLKYLLTSKQQKLQLPDNGESSTMLKTLALDKEAISSTIKPHFTWMGHASCYYQTNGIYILTDPAFSERASFSQYFGPKRFMPAPVDIEDLAIDVVLLSHTHYDHLDKRTAQRIGNRAKWVVPLGTKAVMESFGVTNCVELDWWSSYHHLTASGSTVEIVFTPSKHWTARNFTDRNTCLWGSYVVLSQKSRFFFTGDTAYDPIFKRIGAKYGPFDLAAVSIGAYSPRWFMKDVHNNPEEAIEIHKDLNAKQSVAVHWGTFPLADEDPIEPALELARMRDIKGVSSSEFFAMAHGETVQLGSASKHDLATVRSDLYGIYLDSLRQK